jgi:hypothetical protein
MHLTKGVLSAPLETQHKVPRDYREELKLTNKETENINLDNAVLGAFLPSHPEGKNTIERRSS